MNTEAERFERMLSEVRAGEPSAIETFVSIYEPYIRRTIRFRLARTELRAVADSVDVCQSVFSSFLIRLSAGEYALHSEEDLRKLLYSMAHHKFLALARRELAKKRDRRTTVSLNALAEIVDRRHICPDRSLALKEMVSEFERRLAGDEKRLYDLRRRGASWNEIGEETCEDATVLRKRLSRAVKRIALELGIEE